jgi:hypothetical protein
MLLNITYFRKLPISKLIVIILFPMFIYFNANVIKTSIYHAAHVDYFDAIEHYKTLAHYNPIGCCHMFGYGTNHILCCHKYIPLTYNQCIGYNKLNYIGGYRQWNNTPC